MCYRLPFSVEGYQVGCKYSSMQTLKSYNKAAGANPINEIVSQTSTNGVIDMVVRYNLANYPGKMLKKLIPNGCDLIEETQHSEYPECFIQYKCPKRPDALRVEIDIIFHKERKVPIDFF